MAKCHQSNDMPQTLQTGFGVVMEVQEYEGAYYQIQDEVMESLPVEKDEDAFLD